MQSLNFPRLLTGGWRDLEYGPFKEGIDAHFLVKGGPDEPSAAVLRYRPGAKAPLHRHPAMETILVLEGMESDEAGDYPAGAVAFNPPGSQHSVWSENGAYVLVQWNLPVEFL